MFALSRLMGRMPSGQRMLRLLAGTMPFALDSPTLAAKKRSAVGFQPFSKGILPRGIPRTTQTSMRRAAPQPGSRKRDAKLTALLCDAVAAPRHDHPPRYLRAH